MLPMVLLPLSGGVLLYLAQSRRVQPPLIDALTAAPIADTVFAPDSSKTEAAVEQKLALSLGLLGMTTVGHWVIPFWRLLSLPGLIYLDLHFMRTAYHAWQAERRVNIATNDAVLVTGLLVTQQFAAGSLFATLFFTSCTLQKQAERNLAHYLTLSRSEAGTVLEADTIHNAEQDSSTQLVAVQGPPFQDFIEVVPNKPGWKDTIDQAALPLLTLSAITIPWLGMGRSLAVLLTNFGYDYRLTAPLGTLTYLKAAHAQGIWLRNVQVLDHLQQVDVLVLDVEQEEEWLAALQTTPLTQTMGVVRQTIGVRNQAAACDPIALLAELHSQGQRVAYVSDRPERQDLPVAAEILITTNRRHLATTQPLVHVVLTHAQPAQLQQLFSLSTALQATHRRSFYLALAPGLLNLGGIYLGHFDVLAAITVDYVGAFVGVINAMLPVQSGEQNRVPVPTTTDCDNNKY